MPEAPDPAANTVEIWWLSLRAEAAAVARAFERLSPEERARAERFRFARDRERFVLGRSAMRTILGGRLGEDPPRVALSTAAAGKPVLPPETGCHFNLSHSGDRGVFAVAPRPLGVDLEAHREIPDALAMAERFFAPGEVDALRATPPAERSSAFLRGWTRKEAFVKAKGDGLQAPLGSFQVSLEAGASRVLLGCEPGDERWQIVELEAGIGWFAAPAVEGDAPSFVERIAGTG